MKLQKIALLSMSVMIAAAALPGISNADNASQCKKKEASVRLLLKKGHTSYLSLNSKGYPHRGVNATGSEAKEFREVLWPSIKKEVKGFNSSCRNVKGYTIPKDIMNFIDNYNETGARNLMINF